MDHSDLALIRSVEDFLYLEADLLDERRLDEWLEMLHEDLEYAMPVRQNVHSGDLGREFTVGGRDTLWFDEGKDTLTKRVRQLQTGEHWAEEPISRVSHLVSNVRIATHGVGPGGDGVEVSSRFVVYRNRIDVESDTLIGRRRDVLVPDTEHGWRLRNRLVLLDQSVLLAKNLTVFF